MRKFSIKLLLVVLVFALVVPSVQAADKIKIGLSFADFDIERWPREKDRMVKLGEEAGAEVFYEVANQDAALQNNQIENMVLKGADVIIIVPIDRASAATAVDQAAAAGVRCIAYERLILSDMAAYISFDYVAVGRAQTKDLLEVVNEGKFVLLGGDPNSYIAKQLRKGQMEALQPLIDNNKIKIVSDEWVGYWTRSNARITMANILDEHGVDGVDAVVGSSGEILLGALEMMAEKDREVPTSFPPTFYTDFRLLPEIAIDMAIKLAKGEEIAGLKDFTFAELTLDKSLTGSVASMLLSPASVDLEDWTCTNCDTHCKCGNNDCKAKNCKIPEGKTCQDVIDQCKENCDSCK